MGNGCTKNIRRLNKNTIAPNSEAKTSPITITNHEESTKFPATPNVGNKSNRNESIPTVAANHHSNTSRLETFDHIGRSDARLLNSSSNFDSDAFNLSSCIDTKSIIFDKSDSTTVRPSFTRSVSVDSSSDKSVQSAGTKGFSTHLHRLFKSNQNLTSTSNTTSKTENNRSLPKIYHRLSGSVQSLFSGNLNNNRKRNLSASDTNLNRINQSALSQQQLIDNDYCPSVLYNRKERKSYSEKNLDKTQTFSRWKNQLWLKFSRKKPNPAARKS